MSLGSSGNDTTPAKILCKSGLLSNMGGIGPNSNILNSINLLNNNSITSTMDRIFRYAAGALGNRLNVSVAGSKGELAGLDELQSISNSTFTALSKVGNQLLPGLSSVLPADIATTTIDELNGIFVTGVSTLANVPKDASSQFALAGGFKGTLEFAVHNMTGGDYNTLGSVAIGSLNGNLPILLNNTNRNLLKHTNIINVAASAIDNNKALVSAISDGVSIKFGAGPTGYGPKVRNMQDAMTFSITTLGQNIAAISTDMINMGRWDISDLMRLMQPGQVALQILKRGNNNIGLIEELVNLGVPVAGIDNPLFDSLTLQALININSPYAINYIKSVFAMNIDISNLGDLCLLEKMMLTSKDFLPVQNFRELGVHLSYIGISLEPLTMSGLGNALLQIETASDLNHISQLETPIPDEVGAHLMQVYGFGGGAFGEQTIVDFIGTAGGYVHPDTIVIIAPTSTYISDHPEAKALNTLTAMFENLMKGAYTSVGLLGDATANPAIPDELGSIIIPFSFGTQSFETLDEAVLFFIPLIEAEHSKLLNTKDAMLLDNIKKLDVAYRASCAQLIRENNSLKSNNINLFDIFPQTSDAVTFSNKLDSWALDTEYGSPSNYIERIATDDIYGNAVIYIMRQARNANVLNELGVDVEQFNLPKSQYYTDPTSFYENLYSGNMQSKSQNQVGLNLPHTLNEVYALSRYNSLSNNGYEQLPLTDNQKTETYYDLLWKDASAKKIETLGRNVVRQAIAYRTNIVGNYLYVLDSSGNNINFGTIVNNTSLIITADEQFTATILDAVNQLLYGDINTNKTNNPFNTEPMVYGVLELLQEITKDNILSLMETVTGKLLAIDLLNKLLKKFNVKKSEHNTGMDRNDPASWGDSGASSIPL